MKRANRKYRINLFHGEVSFSRKSNLEICLTNVNLVNYQLSTSWVQSAKKFPRL